MRVWGVLDKRNMHYLALLNDKHPYGSGMQLTIAPTLYSMVVMVTYNVATYNDPNIAYNKHWGMSGA